MPESARFSSWSGGVTLAETGESRAVTLPIQPSSVETADPATGVEAAANEPSADAAAGEPAAAEPARKRPKPGERRIQILQALAGMLEQPGAERITTAALAARLEVSEAALYRHFASKAQMFEGLIEFIEQSVFTLVNQVVERETDPAVQVQRILALTLQFGEKNPGMTRVMVGDALVFENERLGTRMNQFFDRLESQLRQSFRALAEASGSQSPTVDAQARASAAVGLILGRLHRFARSGFKRQPTEHLEATLRLVLA
ncbi:MAG: nucleoid occlusion factor SlmA [Aquabacterium sp.]|jgi:TetR/AcrR family transcriptional regulator|nr:MAG: nucleoid occlusion factor SlmA [Aquabacterium sp.]